MTAGASNTGVGYEAMKGVMGANASYNTALGYQAGKVLAGNSNSNVAIGAFALDAAAENDRNTVIGYGALGAADDGEDGNVVIGYSAGASINQANADENVIIGYEAGTGGSGGAMTQCTVIGAHAMKSTDTATVTGQMAIGHKALKSLTTGDQNTCVGFLGGEDITTHSANTTLGWKAGMNIAGDHNTCIGSSAGDGIVSGQENIIIGSQSDTTENYSDNAIVIGKSVTGPSDTFSFGKSGNVVSNTFTSNANFSHSSDKRLKREIKDNTLGLNFINELKTKTYKWLPSNKVPKELTEHYNEENKKDTDVLMYGMLAQDVKEAMDKYDNPEFTGWNEKSDGSQNISREMFVIPLIKAVQELSQKNEALEKRIQELEK